MLTFASRQIMLTVKTKIMVKEKPLMWNGPVVGGEPQYKRIVIRHRSAA
jgi:hypothetical protein